MGNNNCCKVRDPIGRPSADLFSTPKFNPDDDVLSLPRYTADPNVHNVPKTQYRPQVAQFEGITERLPGSRPIVIALCTYKAREHTDISFAKGDRMEVIDDHENDWWQALHLATGSTGLIPRNFVAIEKSIESEDWFFGNINRKEGDKLLLAEENNVGTYLVRPSEHNPAGYSLSVKDWEESRGFHVKHYKIKPLDSDGYYISTNQIFPSLKALVNAYEGRKLGVCSQLTKPCPKPQPQMWDISPELRDKYEIPRSEIQLIHKLGQGNFGEVHYGKWRNHTDVAVKTLKPGTMSTEAFLDEAAIMKKFRHINLVALYAVCTREEPIYIIQEYMCNGSLLDFLRNGEGRKLQMDDLIAIAAQVASGMKYLELKSLIHRDLAARNVLIGKKYEAKISDFGLARVIDDDEYSPRQGIRFPIKWTAPEAIQYHAFSIKSDVWSFGIFLMELFTYGQVPYPGMTTQDVIQQVGHGYRMPKPPTVVDDIYHIMLQCWDATAKKRPTFEFLAHYFDGYGITSELPYKDCF